MKMYYKQWLGICTLAISGLFMTNPNYAQVGNTCGTPLEITSLPYDHAGSMADYGNDYSSFDVPPTAPGALTNGSGSSVYLSGYDVVYSYTPSENSTINITTTNDEDYIGLWVFTGCPFEATVGYHTQYLGSTRTIEGLNVIANNTYYIVLSNWPPIDNLDFTIHVETGIPDCPEQGLNFNGPCDDGDPNTHSDMVDENCDCVGTPVAANDEACDAILLTCGSEIVQSLAGTSSSMNDACFGSGSADVWFTFVSDGAQMYTVSENTSFDAVVQLFMGEDCGNLTEVGACSDSPENFSVSEAGTYYFRVRPYYSPDDIETIGVDLACTAFDCPDLSANIGDPCDDGNAGTFNDAIDENCDCNGTLPQPCENSVKWPNSVQIVSADLQNISICQYFGEFSEVGGIVAGEEYTFTATGNGWITVRSGAVDGPAIGYGESSVTVTAPNADNLFVHWNDGADCSSSSGCRTTTMQCTSCPIVYDCPELELNIGDACDDGNPNSLNDTVNADCVCVGVVPSPNDNCSSAVALNCDQPISHHTHGATPSEGLSNACGGFSSSDARDVWFGFQADGSSDYTLTLSSDTSVFDGVMFVYSGSCGSLVEVACSDDSGGAVDETITLTAPDAGIYYVRVYDYFGTGEYTMGLTCVDNTPPCEDPFPAVDGLNAQIQGAGIMFSWNPAPNQIGCQFRINPINGGTVTRTIGGANASSQFVPAQYLAYGTTYTWAVRCGCSQNPIVAGPWVSSTFTTPGGAAIMSSPNPTSDVSNVTFSVIEEGFTTLEVYDMNGRSIETLYRANAQPDGDYRFEFNGSDLPAGVYIYRLTTDTEVVIEKFMITK